MSKNLVAANVETLFQALKAGTLTSLPVVHAAELARKLYGSDAVAVAASTRDKGDAFKAQRDLAQSFFISAAAHNDSARFERYCEAMRASPAWKVNSKGTAIGSAAKLVAKFAAIVNTGKNMYSKDTEEVDFTGPIYIGHLKDMEPVAKVAPADAPADAPAADAPAADAPAADAPAADAPAADAPATDPAPADAPAADAPADLQVTAFESSLEKQQADFINLARILGIVLTTEQRQALGMRQAA